MIFSSLHTHTTYCDGANTPEEMVLEAIQQGCSEIGFSSHSYVKQDSEGSMSLKAQENYKNEILRLKDKYSGKIKIFLGIEYDTTSDVDVSDYDYIIGSAHYCQKNGTLITIDKDAFELKTAIKELYDSDAYAFVEDYYKEVSKVYDKTGCDIIGHFDLITKFIETDNIFDINSERYRECALDACHTLLKTPAVFEINTGAISKGYRTTPYPSAFIIKELVNNKADLLITSDTHSRETLLFGMQEAADMLDGMGATYLTGMEQVLVKTRKK